MTTACTCNRSIAFAKRRQRIMALKAQDATNLQIAERLCMDVRRVAHIVWEERKKAASPGRR